MDAKARLNAAGMAFLLARLSGRIRDREDLECIERSLVDYCEAHGHRLIRCSTRGFDIELVASETN